MRYGPTRIYQKRQSLYDIIEESGSGYTGISEDPGLPPECFEFTQAQFQRFNIPFPEEAWEIYHRSVNAVISYIDYVDPYSVLINLSDLAMTDDWEKYTYEFKGRAAPEEGDPERIETFRYVPGQSDHWFNFMMSNPGLKAIPYGIGEGLEGEVECWLEGDRMDGIAEWETVVRVCGDKVKNYAELCAWAIFAWVCGPHGRDWRMEWNAIFDAGITFGEVVLNEGQIIAPRDFKKVARPPQSCYKCSLDAWCTEIVEVDGITRYICEYCLNGGQALYPDSNCGSRMCKFVTCPRHPNHNQFDPAKGLYDTMRGGGGLLTSDKDQRLRIA